MFYVWRWTCDTRGDKRAEGKNVLIYLTCSLKAHVDSLATNW